MKEWQECTNIHHSCFTLNFDSDTKSYKSFLGVAFGEKSDKIGSKSYKIFLTLQVELFLHE